MDRRQFLQHSGLGAIGAYSLLHAGIAHAADSFPPLPVLDVATPRLDDHGRTLAWRRYRTRYLRIGLDDAQDLDLIAVPATRLRMGAPAREPHCGTYECRMRSVQTTPFYLARTPVTQAQWRAVAALPAVARDIDAAPACFEGDTRPVECVSWLDAQEFCARLTRATGHALRLPSEAEWEAACRAGSRTPFHFGETLTAAHARYAASHVYAAEQPAGTPRSTMPVAQHAPNALGLHDMHGNVWEWCADHWHDSYAGAPADSRAWQEGGRDDWRSLRGGSWADAPGRLRSASRSGYPAAAGNRVIGLRIALSLVAA